MKEQNVLKIDAENIWHPLTQHKTAMTPKAISHAKGNYLYDFEGNAYFDAISSWYTCSYGHANPKLTDAIKAQVDQLHHVVFAGMTHEPAAVLSEKLLKILPFNQSKLFFSENGSTSVEIALKMAFQYHYNRGERRNVVVALENGFHGDTFGAMSASGLEETDRGTIRDFISNNKTKLHPEAYRLKTPMSPHKSAEIDGVRINLDQIKRPETGNDLVVEGAGGLLVPLNEEQTIVDLIVCSITSMVPSRLTWL